MVDRKYRLYEFFLRAWRIVSALKGTWWMELKRWTWCLKRHYSAFLPTFSKISHIHWPLLFWLPPSESVNNDKNTKLEFLPFLKSQVMFFTNGIFIPFQRQRNHSFHIHIKTFCSKRKNVRILLGSKSIEIRLCTRNTKQNTKLFPMQIWTATKATKGIIT